MNRDYEESETQEQYNDRMRDFEIAQLRVDNEQLDKQLQQAIIERDEARRTMHAIADESCQRLKALKWCEMYFYDDDTTTLYEAKKAVAEALK